MEEMEENVTRQQIHISVRNLVEFIFREGDIDNRRGRALTPDAMQEGSRIHRKIQGSQGANYRAEVPLKILLTEDIYELLIEGRADGIFTELEGEGELVWIDEIKGMYRNVLLMKEPYYVHQAQAMVYAYIYARDNHLTQIGIQMTYCSLDSDEVQHFRTRYSFEELEEWFEGLRREYHKWAEFSCRWKETRTASIRSLEFPFSYRKGQKKLAGDVYRTILREKNLFIQAPTGVGKTITTLFPALKAMGEGLSDRIFYLTAKTVTAQVARDTFALLSDKGLKAKTIHLTAKEKMCLCEEMECNPVNCPYAAGHFDRVNDAVFELLQQEDQFGRENLLSQAEKHRVCPFEMQLDVSSWCDAIICDYNYAFDPTAKLKRFFQEGIKEDYIFLIDEAHNLVERGREMYSAELCKEDILAMKKLMKPHSKPIERLLDKANRTLLEYKRECETYLIHEEIGTLLYTLTRLASELSEFLEKPGDFAGRQEVLDFYLNLRSFLNIYELTDEHYVIYSRLTEEGHFVLRLFCVDPSANLQECLDLGRSAIFFSATFLPIAYYKGLLSTREDNYAVYAETTFTPDQQLLLLGRDVSTKYTRRTEEEFRRIAEYIGRLIRCRQGNYMIFLPSYRVMEQVYAAFTDLLPPDSGVRTICQQSGMKEVQREEFLQEFEHDREETLVAFCVMGGIFGEGIDLKQDRLIGAVVVGTGLPQISYEREILKNYYDARNGAGFDYAFRYPGMNKVLQAAGRVIRTEEDRGVILLLDERFLQKDYRSLFPREWEERHIVDAGQIEGEVRSFWEEADRNREVQEEN